MKFIAVIPARYASSRFPGKPLATLGGKLVIERVYEQVSSVLDEVYVATDDERIYNAVVGFGGKAIMTSDKHKSGTDRIAEAVEKIESKADVVINIQGDEPFIHPDQIRTVMSLFDDNDTESATLGKPFESMDAADNPNSPKIVVGQNGRALYFSRSVIPFVRGKEHTDWLKYYPFLKHIGLYAYRRETLMKITKLEQTPLELAESLEQLRWLEHGIAVKVGTTNCETIGIDTPEDLQRAEEFIKKLAKE
ncbi:MAG: 3-deoxy-manno-octulosonate cytidylyltransferase [Prevotella sp.]|nr:3-deoxy-manno-octulosonate cytidylyltransferase [Prevotella sp.]